MRRYILDGARSELVVWTSRKGLLARLGHDLKISLRALDLELEGAPEDPDWRARLRAPLHRLEVLGAVEPGEAVPEMRRLLPGALEPADIEEIQGILACDILDFARFPEAVFECRAADRKDAAYPGRLQLRGREGPVTVIAHWSREGEDLSIAGSARLKQSDFGIKPYRALGGAIKLRDELELSWDLRFSPAP